MEKTSQVIECWYLHIIKMWEEDKFCWQMELHRNWNFRSERKEDQDATEIIQEILPVTRDTSAFSEHILIQLRMPPVLLKVPHIRWLETMKLWLIAVIKDISLLFLLWGIEVSLRAHSRQKVQQWLHSSTYEFCSAQVKKLISQLGFHVKKIKNTNHCQTRVQCHSAHKPADLNIGIIFSGAPDLQSICKRRQKVWQLWLGCLHTSFKLRINVYMAKDSNCDTPASIVES